MTNFVVCILGQNPSAHLQELGLQSFIGNASRGQVILETLSHAATQSGLTTLTSIHLGSNETWVENE